MGVVALAAGLLLRLLEVLLTKFGLSEVLFLFLEMLVYFVQVEDLLFGHAHFPDP